MDIEKRNNLILNNLKLVHYQYNRKFSSLPIEKEDIISIGILGLIKAIDNYDKEKGYTFSTYALKCIDNEILQGVKKNKSLANINLKDKVNKKLEEARNEKLIGSALEAVVKINLDQKYNEVKEKLGSYLHQLFIVSKVEYTTDGEEVVVEKSTGEKCNRCWNYVDHLNGDICDRCHNIINS